jgi:hypothetical protein
MWFLNALSATWNWLLRGFVAAVSASWGWLLLIWGALRSRPVISTTMACALLVLGGAAFYFSPELSDTLMRARPGQIIVNSPTVYTRQRLVNDRLNQASWLRDQLKLADRITAEKATEPFRMIDQVHTRIAEGKMSTGVGSSKKADSTQTSPTEDPPTPKELFTVTPTTAALFRAKNAFREEVRGEMTQTQLDDRHDIRGNTIYRLSFDATVAAGSKKNAVAVINITLGHYPDKPPRNKAVFSRMYEADYEALYFDWLRFAQEAVPRSLDGLAQSLQSSFVDPSLRRLFTHFLISRTCALLAGNGPDRERIDPSCDPGSTDATARENTDRVTNLLNWFMTHRLGQLRDQDEQQLASVVTPLIDRRVIVPVDVATLLTLAGTACRGRTSPVVSLFELGLHTPESAQSMKKEGLQPPVVGCPFSESAIERLVAGITFYEMIVEQVTASPPPPQTSMLVDAERAKNGLHLRVMSRDYPERDNATRCFAADFIKAKLNALENEQVEPSGRMDYFFKLDVVGRALKDCQIRIAAHPQSKQKAAELPHLLNRSTEVFSYSVSPKTLTENISTAIHIRDAYETLVNYGLRIGDKEAVAFANKQNDRSDRLQAILSHPLIIGFGAGNHDLREIADPAQEERKTTAINQTSFGWLIAPRSRGGQTLEQIDGQYPLTAVISVPSWWRSVETRIATCWIARDNLNRIQDKKKQGVEVCDGEDAREEFTVIRLPGAIPELSRKLGLEVQQEPHLSEYSPQELEIGQRGSLLLRGGRLWRSTEVTLGAQRANEITVLPNMEGIIATFNCVLPQTGVIQQDTSGANRRIIRTDVYVWTSEGVTKPPLKVDLVWPPARWTPPRVERPKTSAEAAQWCGWETGFSQQ